MAYIDYSTQKNALLSQLAAIEKAERAQAEAQLKRANELALAELNLKKAQDNLVAFNKGLAAANAAVSSAALQLKLLKEAVPQPPLEFAVEPTATETVSEIASEPASAEVTSDEEMLDLSDDAPWRVAIREEWAAWRRGGEVGSPPNRAPFTVAEWDADDLLEKKRAKWRAQKAAQRARATRGGA